MGRVTVGPTFGAAPSGGDSLSAAVAVTVPAATWRPCSTCWGQRRIYEDRNGEGLVPCVCPDCLGLGEHLVFGSQPFGS